MAHHRFWHVGNWCIHTGQKYIESPFLGPTKGVEVLNYAEDFVHALQAIPSSEVISEPSWDLYNMSPEKFAERIDWATCIIFGDVETKCLMLHPDFFNRHKWNDGYVTFPDRVELLKEWVTSGGHFHMNGGWVLPVICREGDDLIESTASYNIRSANISHPVLKGIDLEEVPPILGFNQTKLRSGAKALLEIEAWGEWHPLLAIHDYGKGKVSAFTTSASPHWGINLVKWPQYDKLWKQFSVTIHEQNQHLIQSIINYIPDLCDGGMQQR
ncbi:MAG: glutamine amidotransferase [Cyclobacteriaceae bacterium]